MTDKPITPARPVRVGNTPPSSATELSEGKGSRSRAGWFDAANVHGFHPTDDELDRGWIEWLSVRRAVILQSPDDTKYQNNLRRLLNSDCERGACICREAQKRAGGIYMVGTDGDGQGFTYQTTARTETEYLVESSVFLSWLFAQGLSPSKHVTAWNSAIANPAPAQNTATPAPVTDSEWVTKAQIRAREIVKESRESDRYPSQEAIGDLVASEFRRAGIVGIDGKPLTGATIKRHALKGISSAIGKQLSTTIRQGK